MIKKLYPVLISAIIISTTKSMETETQDLTTPWFQVLNMTQHPIKVHAEISTKDVEFEGNSTVRAFRKTDIKTVEGGSLIVFSKSEHDKINSKDSGYTKNSLIFSFKTEGSCNPFLDEQYSIDSSLPFQGKKFTIKMLLIKEYGKEVEKFKVEMKDDDIKNLH